MRYFFCRQSNGDTACSLSLELELEVGHERKLNGSEFKIGMNA